MPLARMAAPIAINTTGHTYPGRRSKTSSCSRRNTTPSTTNTSPATSAERLYLASIDGHLPDAHREFQSERSRAAGVRRGQGEVHVETAVLLAQDGYLPEPGLSVSLDWDGGNVHDQFPHTHSRLHHDEVGSDLDVPQVEGGGCGEHHREDDPQRDESRVTPGAGPDQERQSHDDQGTIQQWERGDLDDVGDTEQPHDPDHQEDHAEDQPGGRNRRTRRRGGPFFGRGGRRLFRKRRRGTGRIRGRRLGAIGGAHRRVPSGPAITRTIAKWSRVDQTETAEVSAQTRSGKLCSEVNPP